MDKIILALFVATMAMISCQGKDKAASESSQEPQSVVEIENHVERIDTCGLIILFPKFSTIDLVCGTEPQKSDTSVILMAEAAFTGQCLDRFDHFNIAGNHVSQGKKYKGYLLKTK